MLIAIVVLTVIAKQPAVTAVLLPVLTGLFVIYADRWLNARERVHPSEGRDHDLGGRASELAKRLAPRSRGTARASASSSHERTLLITTLVLFVFGMVMVYSSSSHRPGLFAYESATIGYFIRFTIYGLGGVALMMLLARDGMRLARRFTAALLLSSFAFVLGTYIPGVGVSVNGARRWIGVGVLQFQPSELLKVALILYAAQLVANRPKRVNDFSELAQPLLYVTGAGCLLVMSQPDLGTATVIAVAVAALLLGAGLQMRIFLASVGSVLAFIAVYALALPYARARLTTFIDPWAHASSTGFQAVQGQIAIGSGGLFGRGLGESIQKAYYLPEANTDFILAVLGEELGLVGIGVLLFLYGLLAYTGLRIARMAKGLYSSLVAIGLTSMIVAQAIINVFSVLGLAPEEGLALPFVSYGTTDLLVTFIAVGLLLNIAREATTREPDRTGSVSGNRLPTLTRARIGMLFAFLLMLLVLAGARSFYLDAVEGGRLRRVAAEQQLAQEVVPAPRGPITDRFGTQIVGSEAASDVSADPYKLADPELAAPRLAALLGEPVAVVLRKLQEKTGFVYLARGLPQYRVKQILALEIPGISATPTTRRTYPRGPLAGQVLGLVGSEGYGLAGLEYGWNKLLSGRSGERRVILNALGQPLSVQQTKRMVPGAPLQLTLDSYIQGEAEYILADIAARCSCNGVASVVMNPETGEILAMANWPRMPLANASSLGVTELATDLENRVIGYNLEPGSMVDVFSVAGALDEGFLTSSQSIFAPARMQVGADLIESYGGTGRDVTVGQIAEGDSETGTLRVASRLGLNRVVQWLRRFGLGAPTGIDLPGESAGRIPSEREYDHTTLGTLPIGHGMTVTPMQLATAYAAIANGGILRAPHVVAEVSGKPVAATHSVRILSRSVAESLRHIIAGSAGTGVEADSTEARAAHDAAFVGLGPGSEAQVLTVTIVAGERGAGSAESLAASAFRQIMAFVLPYLGTH
ncbi:MAG: putative lipid II flippase FtsW [Solirubrobacteraceae bacterium]